MILPITPPLRLDLLTLWDFSLLFLPPCLRVVQICLKFEPSRAGLSPLVKARSINESALQHLAAAADELQAGRLQPGMGRPGCRDKCGGMSIPFLFGMDKPGCFLPGFEVTCNTSSTPPRAFLAYNSSKPPYQVSYQSAFGTETTDPEYRYQAVELFDISLETNEVRV